MRAPFHPGPPRASAPEALPPAFRRNFVLGVVNGILFNASAAFISTTLVLPGLIVECLGGGNVLVGALAAIDQGGWLLPQLLVGARTQGRPRHLPIYRAAALIRALCFGGLVAVVALAGRLSHTATLALFFTFYIAYSLGAGVAGVPFQEVVARTIPPERRGAYFGLRAFGGGLLTLLVVSPAVGLVLAAGSPWGFPTNYTILFIAACVLALAGLATFSLVVERPAQQLGRTGSLATQLRAVPELWRTQPPLRRFLFYKVLSRLGAIAEPFYIVYAARVLGTPAALVGEYMAAITVVQLLSYLVWSRLSDRRGNRLLLRWGSGLAALAPPLALALPCLGNILGLSPAAGAYLFGLVFITSGLGNAGLGIGLGNYILELLPEGARPAGLGLVNTVTGMIGLLTILGGTLADLLGYAALFLAAAVLALGSFLMSLPLVEPRNG